MLFCYHSYYLCFRVAIGTDASECIYESKAAYVPAIGNCQHGPLPLGCGI